MALNVIHFLSGQSIYDDINLIQSRKKMRQNYTKIESKGLVLSPQGADMVLPWQGSETHVTICPALRTALIKWGSLTLKFSAPILTIIVILPGLLWGFKISMRLTSSFGSILSLTCIHHKCFYQPCKLSGRNIIQWPINNEENEFHLIKI